MSRVAYADRPLDTQIRIDNLMKYHGYKYPLSWYETLSERQIRAMHTDALVHYARTLQERYG